jgi:DNA repair exonuclease SbcCD ATPase subunit
MDLAARELGRPPLLMFDEVLDGLDHEGQERVIRLLHELRGRFGSIFVITHEADISEAFEHVVRVTKAEDGSSTVEVVS